jgi:hypothetical protein
MSIFKSKAKDVLNDFEAPGLIESLFWTTREDRSALEDATTSQIREAFRTWVQSTEVDQELAHAVIPELGGPGTEMLSPSELLLKKHMLISPRYRFCIQVDEIALNSVLRYHNQGNSFYSGHVNVISLNWELPDPDDEEHANATDLGYDTIDQGELPIESCRLYDVGWMRCDIGHILPTLYSYLIKNANFEEWYYRRPPAIANGWNDRYYPPDDIALPKL